MNNTTKSIVKTLHILFACLWLGASTSIVLLQNLMGWSNDLDELAVINKGFTYLDFILIIPGAVGSSLTGLIMCRFTNVGFIRYRWVIAKWAGCIAGILVGSALLGPWQLQMLRLTSQVEGGLLVDTYKTTRIAFAVVGLLQVILLISIITISVKKPWGKRCSSQRESRMFAQRKEALF